MRISKSSHGGALRIRMPTVNEMAGPENDATPQRGPGGQFLAGNKIGRSKKRKGLHVGNLHIDKSDPRFAAFLRNAQAIARQRLKEFRAAYGEDIPETVSQLVQTSAFQSAAAMLVMSDDPCDLKWSKFSTESKLSLIAAAELCSRLKPKTRRASMVEVISSKVQSDE